MSIELKQAAQQAVDAFDAFGDDDDFASLFALAQKMKALHTAIQQAESDHARLPGVLKDHQIAAMVNTLRDIARQFHGHDSLRERIANVLVPALKAEANADEPVAWVVMNGLSKYQVCGAKAPANALCSEMQKRHDLSGSLAAFHVQPLYTHPAPGVPEDVAQDAQRYRWLRRKACVIGKTTYCGEETGQPILDFVNLPDVTEVIRRDSASTLDAAIDAAMLAASTAQKGGE